MEEVIRGMMRSSESEKKDPQESIQVCRGLWQSSGLCRGHQGSMEVIRDLQRSVEIIRNLQVLRLGPDFPLVSAGVYFILSTIFMSNFSVPI